LKKKKLLWTPYNTKKIPRLRFVLPPDTTPALRILLLIDSRGSPLQDNPSAHSLNSLPVGSIIEALPEGLLLVQDITDWIERCRGGAALIVNYSGDGSSGGDTLRGFYRHMEVHPLSRPGEVDVTSDVDFGALREAMNRRMSLEESLERRMRWEEGRARRGRKGGDATDKVVVGGAPSEDRSKTTAHDIRPEAFGHRPDWDEGDRRAVLRVRNVMGINLVIWDPNRPGIFGGDILVG